jgi:hypothetical protein
MAAVCATDRGDIPGMPRGRQPIMYRRANSAPLDGRLSATLMPGDQQ